MHHCGAPVKRWVCGLSQSETLCRVCNRAHANDDEPDTATGARLEVALGALADMAVAFREIACRAIGRWSFPLEVSAE